MSAWSTASPDLRDRWTREGAIFEEIVVSGVTAADLITEFGIPYYAKVDIEGFDLVFLRGFRTQACRPKYISIEIDFGCIDEIFETALGLGYRRFSVVGQTGVPKQRSPRPSLEGSELDFTFRLGSTGLFGKERIKCNAAAWRISRSQGRVRQGEGQAHAAGPGLV